MGHIIMEYRTYSPRCVSSEAVPARTRRPQVGALSRPRPMTANARGDEGGAPAWPAHHRALASRHSVMSCARGTWRIKWGRRCVTYRQMNAETRSRLIYRYRCIHIHNAPDVFGLPYCRFLCRYEKFFKFVKVQKIIAIKNGLHTM